MATEYRHMKNLITLSCLVGFTLLSSCDSSLDLLDYVDVDDSFTLTINQKDDNTGLTKSKMFDIDTNTVIHTRLVSWISENERGWITTPASYNIEVAISQGDFHLPYFHDGFVVINFLDENHEGHQYKKEITEGELDFLISK